MRSVALVSKVLTWFFLLIFQLILPLLKNLSFDLLLVLYRGYRKVKLLARKIISPENNAQRTWLTSIFVSLISLVVIISNVHANTTVREFGSQSLIAGLILDEFNDFTVVKANNTEVITEITTNIPQLIAAIENLPESEIDKGTTIISTNKFTSSVAENTGAVLTPSGTNTQETTRRKATTHTIKQGQNISMIATSYGLKTNTVLWANNLTQNSTIRPGDELKIPHDNGVLHKVKKNETLSGLAVKYEIDIKKIMDINNLVSANQLQIGNELLIPGAKIVAPVSTTRLAQVRQIFNPNPSKISNSDFVWPTTSRRITQYYWLRHRGIDVGRGGGSLSIVASKGGTVSHSGWSNGYGINVVVEHSGGVKTRYAHLSKTTVVLGERIAQGEQLGVMGTTGRSTGIHLHFEIIDNGKYLNPLSYL